MSYIHTASQLRFKSTTITLTLSELLLPKARRVSSAAARALRDGYNAPALSSSIRGGPPVLVLVLVLPGSKSEAEEVLPSRRHSLATSQANSFDRTSHMPSLAIIKHSSSGSLLVNVISGCDITIGFRYLSPVIETQLILGKFGI